ncbi:competence/damage-inducible protein CinA-like protein [Idiomarina sp. A28L]|uniref:CinA family protein n=1 Tax=Idiomarina sp. A28L TaxID=1036674 RepID=UPI00021387E4|nr:CinA family protein [Idiomarina sp. A28L]EGN75700.1 competence/damage-inducible protein CinA-like protein [Idiomarina sp. A28L]
MITKYQAKSFDNEIMKALSESLQKRGWMLATAESCTGGGIAAACTDLSGSSGWFEGGIVSYSNAMKSNLLGVSDNLLSNFGAVSPECAAAMAKGVCKLLGVAVGVSTTGIAGPSGGSAEKPVGMVCFGFSVAENTWTDIQYFNGDRDQIRQQTVAYALKTITDYIVN